MERAGRQNKIGGEWNVRKKQTLIALMLLCTVLLSACRLLPDGSGSAPSGQSEPAAETELDGSVFMDYMKDQTDADYYALIPGENGEAMLLLSNVVSFHEAGVDDEGVVYPEDGYYSPDASFLRYESGVVQYIDFFHSMTNLTIDRENRILYRTWSGQGVYQDIATSYPDYTLAQWSRFYDSIDRPLDGAKDGYLRNDEPISAETYEQILAERQASREAVVFYEIVRDNDQIEPQLHESSQISVEPGGAVMRGGKLYLTFTKYSFEVFPVEVIRGLSEGDVIVREGIPLRVETVDFQEEVIDGAHYYTANINNGYWLSSVGGESGLLAHVGPNDDYYYVATGTDTLPVDEGVSFYDYAEPNASWVNGTLEPVVVPYADIADYFSRDLISLTAEIRGGKIVSLQREWHP